MFASRRRLAAVLVLVGVLAGVLSGGAPGTGYAAVSPRPDPTAASAHSPAAHSPAANVGSADTYQLPLSGPTTVVRVFERPPTPYAAGHRGVDLAVQAEQLVLAPAPGIVAFAGSVAGRGVVVVTHADGITTEYEPIRAQVRPGQTVARGDPIGVVFGEHGACPPNSCLHWGARRGADYFDPMTLLHPLGVVHLVPWS